MNKSKIERLTPSRFRRHWFLAPGTIWIVPSSCCSGSNWANSTAPVEWQHEQEQDRAADAFEISPALVPGAGHDLDRAVIVLFRFQLGKFDRAGRMAA